MRWGRNELERLYPVLEQVSSGLFPVDGKQILVLCSSSGEVVFWLAELMETGKVTGLELDADSLQVARASAREMGLDAMAAFLPAGVDRLPFPDASFDALVTDLIVYPSLMPAQVSSPEILRVLRPGGKVILTDVIVTQPLPPQVREALAFIGLDHAPEATPDSFKHWMTEAGLANLQVLDLTSTVRGAWELRRAADKSPSHETGYAYLLDIPNYCLGKAIFYLYVSAEKPGKPGSG